MNRRELRSLAQTICGISFACTVGAAGLIVMLKAEGALKQYQKIIAESGLVTAVMTIGSYGVTSVLDKSKNKAASTKIVKPAPKFMLYPVNLLEQVTPTEKLFNQTRVRILKDALLRCNSSYQRDKYLHQIAIEMHEPLSNGLASLNTEDRQKVVNQLQAHNFLQAAELNRISEWIGLLDEYHRTKQCHGCCNYYGQTDGGNKLICAVHPYGPTSNSCADWETKMPFGHG